MIGSSDERELANASSVDHQNEEFEEEGRSLSLSLRTTKPLSFSIDQCLEEVVGECGVGQIKQFLLSSSAWLPASYLTLFQLFTQRQPTWECSAIEDFDDYEDITHQYNRSAAIVLYEKCEVMRERANEGRTLDALALCRGRTNANSNSDNSNERIKWQWTNEKQSIVSEFNLICENEYKVQLASSMLFVGFFFGAGLLGQLSDRKGRRVGVYAAVLISSLGALLGSISREYSHYFVAVFISGFGVGGIGVASFVLCTEPLGISWKGVMGIGTQYWWSFGICSMSFFAYLMQENWRLYSFFCSLVGLTYCVITAPFLKESPRWLLANGKAKEAREVLKFLAMKNGRLVLPASASASASSRLNINNINNFPDLKEPDENKDDVNVNVSAIFPHQKLKLRLKCMMFVFACNGLIYYGISLNVGNLAGNIYLNNFLSGLVEIPSHIVGQLSVDWFGRRTTLMSLMSLSGFGVLISGFLKGNARIFFALVGRFGIAGSFNVVYLYTTELFPTIVRSAALGSCSMIGRIGSISAPQVLYLRTFSPELPSIILAIFSALAVFTLYRWVPETRGLILEESLEGAEMQASAEEVSRNLSIASQFSNHHHHHNNNNNFARLVNDDDDDDDVLRENHNHNHNNNNSVDEEDP